MIFYKVGCISWLSMSILLKDYLVVYCKAHKYVSTEEVLEHIITVINLLLIQFNPG